MQDKYKKLYEYVQLENRIHDLVGYDDTLLHIFSRKVLEQIRKGESGWEDYVPKPIAKKIVSKCLFGYPCKVED